MEHIRPYRGDEELSRDRANQYPPCKPCHDKKTLTEDIKPVYRC